MVAEGLDDHVLVDAAEHRLVHRQEGTQVVREEDLVRRQEPGAVQVDLAVVAQHVLDGRAGQGRHGAHQVEVGTADDQTVGVLLVLDVARVLRLVVLVADAVGRHAVLADHAGAVDDVLQRQGVAEDGTTLEAHPEVEEQVAVDVRRGLARRHALLAGEVLAGSLGGVALVRVLVQVDTRVPRDVLDQTAVLDARADTVVDLPRVGVEVGIVGHRLVVDVDRDGARHLDGAPRLERRVLGVEPQERHHRRELGHLDLVLRQRVELEGALGVGLHRLPLAVLLDQHGVPVIGEQLGVLQLRALDDRLADLLRDRLLGVVGRDAKKRVGGDAGQQRRVADAGLTALAEVQLVLGVDDLAVLGLDEEHHQALRLVGRERHLVDGVHLVLVAREHERALDRGRRRDAELGDGQLDRLLLGDHLADRRRLAAVTNGGVDLDDVALLVDEHVHEAAAHGNRRSEAPDVGHLLELDARERLVLLRVAGDERGVAQTEGLLDRRRVDELGRVVDSVAAEGVREETGADDAAHLAGLVEVDLDVGVAVGRDVAHTGQVGGAGRRDDGLVVGLVRVADQAADESLGGIVLLHGKLPFVRNRPRSKAHRVEKSTR